MAKWGLADTFNVLDLLEEMSELKKTGQKIGVYTVTTKNIDDHINKKRKHRGLSVITYDATTYNLKKMQEDGFLKFKPKEALISHNWSITEKGRKEWKIKSLELEIISLEKEKQLDGVSG